MDENPDNIDAKYKDTLKEVANKRLRPEPKSSKINFRSSLLDAQTDMFTDNAL